MYVRRRGTLVEVQTPAKVNLFLEVLSRRADGFHEIETLVTPVGLFDRVSLAANSTGTLSLTCRWSCGVESQRRRHVSGAVQERGIGFPPVVFSRTSDRLEAYPTEGAHRLSRDTSVWEAIPAGEDNLLLKSVRRLRELSGVRQGAALALVKRIPAAAGLGGASSDAAAGLVAANIAWGLGWSRQRLADVAAELGSDVPFFLQGGPCLCRGRGERIECVRGWKSLHLVVVRPPAGLSTAQVYQTCRPADQPRRAEAIVAAGRCGDAANVGRLLFNRLEEAAERLSPWIERLRSAFGQLDCLGHQMSGSGTSFVGICRHADHARRVAARLRAAGWGAVFAARTLDVAFRCQ